MAPIQRVPVELKRTAVADDVFAKSTTAKEAVECYMLGERRHTGSVRNALDTMAALREAVVNSRYGGDWMPWFSRAVLAAYNDTGDRIWMYRLIGDAVAYTRDKEQRFLTAYNRDIVDALKTLSVKYNVSAAWSLSLIA